MDMEDDDAFLYGTQSPPAHEAQAPAAAPPTNDVKAKVEQTRSYLFISCMSRPAF